MLNVTIQSVELDLVARDIPLHGMGLKRASKVFFWFVPRGCMS